MDNKPTTEMSDGTSEQMTINWTPGQSPVVETTTNQIAGNKWPPPASPVTSVQDSQPENIGVNQKPKSKRYASLLCFVHDGLRKFTCRIDPDEGFHITETFCSHVQSF